MPAYYNEFDPGAAAWLRELIRKGLIADGYVDERSIIDVRPSELSEFTQCHFFAGIGGWSYALRIAGWPDDRPVWTGSPPCQPFSSAGRQLGKDDSRHLAPHFISLVGACRPRVLFGEQVASSDVFGKAASSVAEVARLADQWDADRRAGKPEGKRRGQRAGAWAWLDDLSDRLEAARYAVGADDIPAAGVGAPNIRQRTFFGAVDLDGLADADRRERLGFPDGEECQFNRAQTGREQGNGQLAASSELCGLADCDGERWFPGAQRGIHCSEEGAGPRHGESERFSDASGLADGHKHGCGSPAIREFRDSEHNAEPCGDSFGLADSGCRLLQSGQRSGDNTSAPRQVEGEARELQRGGIGDSHGCSDDRLVRGGGARSGPLHGFWRDADWLFCRDGKWRPVEPGTFPLAHGVSGRVGLLRGYGNAINPWAAKEFIQAFAGVIYG